MMSYPSSRRLLLRKKSSHAEWTPPSVPGTTHKFDELTGQIYTETTISIQSGDDTNWDRKRSGMRRSHFSLLDKKVKRRKGTKGTSDENGLVMEASKGARSLYDIAIETTIQNLDKASLDVLECVPIPMLERIWDVMNKMCLSSLEIWKIFSKLINQGEAKTPSLLRYSDVILYPRSLLDTYMQPLTSHSFEFLTSLSINIQFSVPDLVKLSKVRNLGILDVTSPSSGPFLCTDSIVRAWGIAANEQGAFPVLRVLRLLNHPDVTTKSILYLNNFPALGLYQVGNYGFEYFRAQVEARHAGWQVIEGSGLPHLEAACAERLESLRASFGIKESSTSSVSAEKDLAGRWDQNSCRLFDKIGELRNDSDLKEPGVAVGTPVSINQNSMSSVAIASLGIGIREFSEPKHAMSFLRIKLPLRLENQHEDTNQNESNQKRVKASKSGDSKIGRKRVSSIPKSKKRKLEDVLNSFI